jgi:UDP-N-acetylmuramate--alanine ligase
MIIDDYAHHPKEIDSTLKSLRAITKKKIISIFEPHRYSRIQGMTDDFISCFVKSDYIYILPIYGAGEVNKKNINNEFLANLMNKKLKKKISAVKNQESFFKELKKIISPGDNIIFMGAGLSSKIAEKFSVFFQN